MAAVPVGPYPPRVSARSPAILPDKILIVRLGAIGDVANALVVAAALAREEPRPKVGWVVHDLAAPLVRGNPCVDRVHLWKRGSGLAGLRRLMQELRAERYGLALDLQRIAKSALFARLSGAPRVLGFDRARCKELSWLLTTERVAPGDRHRHMVQQYLDFVRHLGLRARSPEHVLPSDPAAERRADLLVLELGGAPILVNLGASKPANRWVPGRFGELALAAAERFDAPVCLIGGPDDRRLFPADVEGVQGSRVRDLVGATSLVELWALERRARLFVGLDTGPMHLAAAVGLPCVILFGAADPRRTGPWGDHAIARVGAPCAPCNQRECTMPRHICMEDLPVDLVLAQMEQALASRAATRSAPAGERASC